ncbi:MocR-like transcriptional regulator GabR [Sporosarcina obsidiansis]|uniref:MocR-like transcriptional regulator GabR n=1 Tax=Sporosarcina obsidiansis TaxID=2660748 RepID=UPI00129B3F4D|nr:PLP-dependent aminotransferase family protein [Sporosarcina obsidiansis]
MILSKLELNTEEQDYIYQQIYKDIKEKILEGQLSSHEKLPSKRKLADQLNVSVNSVTNAYEQLLAEGYIYSLERRGYYVEHITQFIVKDDRRKTKLPSALKEENVDKAGWLSLSHMTSDISLFPFKEWIKCQEKAITNQKIELTEITHPQGPYLVRQTIAKLIALSRGVICEPEQIVIGAGTQSLLRNLMSIQSPSTVVAIENPGYSRFYTMLKKLDLEVLPIELDEEGIDSMQIENSNASFVFVTPSHQFPTGKIMSISRRIELLNWSIKSNNRYIIEDDYDSEFKYETDNIPSLQSLDRNQRVIYTGSFSKTMLPGFRISYMVLPPEVLKDYRLHFSDFIQDSNTLGLYSLHYFIESGEYAKHLRRMNHHYEMKRKLLIKQLRLQFGDSLHIEDIPAGLHFLAYFETTKSYSEIEERAIKEKLEIYSMKRFMLKEKKMEKNRIDLVIGFANINAENITEAVERLYTVIRE